MKKSSIATALSAGLATIALVAGCSSHPDAGALHLAGEDPAPFGSAVPDVPGGQSFTFAAIPLCVSTDEDVTITEISPVDGQNLQVVAFATTDDLTNTFGEGPVDLRGAGFDPASHVVTAPCPDQHTELALELKRGSTTAGTGEGFVVTYESASGAGEMEIPFQVRLCPEDVHGYGCEKA